MNAYGEVAARPVLQASEDDAAQSPPLQADVAAGSQYAIVGMAARLPGGSNSPEAFWSLLEQGRDCLGSLSAARLQWPEFIDKDGAHLGIDRAYLLDDVSAQDMAFFGISPKESELMDPQQRLLMELSWETFESAGHKPSAYSGSATGVFIGACHADYRELVASRARSAEAYVGTGNIACMLANRISYYYGFKGPSLTIDTACASSLFAVADAVNALASGACRQALVGAVNLILTPTSSIAYYQAGMLSSRATCNPFDDESDGYIRGEGAGMILIKTLAQARRDRDHVLAVIKGVATNHGGKARSLTAPNALAQAQVINDALVRAGIDVDTVNYVETHGTGTPVGDPIEFQGISRCFTRLAKWQGIELASGHCALGTLKANIGHLEAAAGMAAIIKVLLAMQHRRLPPNHRHRKLNRRMVLAGSSFYLTQAGAEWQQVRNRQGELMPLRAGISSFGFGGTNGHLVLEAADMPVAHPVTDETVLFALSAKTSERLLAYAQKYLQWLSSQRSGSLRLRDLAYTLLIGREAMSQRLAVVASSHAQLVNALQSFVEGCPTASCRTSSDESAASLDEGVLQSWLAQGDLAALAKAWAGGATADFSALFADDARKLPFLPSYPFDRKRFWLPWPEAGAASAVGLPGIHSLLQRNISDFRRQAYRTMFTSQHPVVTGHVIATHQVLPAAAFIVMAQYAIADALGLKEDQVLAGQLKLTALKWLQPLLIGRAPVPVELQLRPLQSREFAVELFAQGEQCVAQGRAQLGERPGTPQVDIEACRSSGMATRVSAAQCYELYERMGHAYQHDFRAIESLQLSPGLLVGHLSRPPELAADSLPVALLDGALQTWIGSVFLSAAPPRSELVVPDSIESVQVYAPCDSQMWAVIRLAAAGGEQSLRRFDVDLCNERGQVCVRFVSVQVTRLSTAQFEHRIQSAANGSDTLERAGDDAGRHPKPFAEVAQRAAPVPVSHSLSEVRAGLIELIATLLRMPSSDIDAGCSFSEYGVDSILVVGLIRQINSRWGCKLAATIIYDCPNVSSLAERIVASSATAEPPVADAGAQNSLSFPEVSAGTATAVVTESARFLPQTPASATAPGYRAVVLREPAEIDAVEIAQLVEPPLAGNDLGDDDVVIAVRAFSLNFGDLLCIRGLYPDMPPYPFTPGFEASGEVIAVGRSVREIAPGDAVIALTGQSLGAHSTRLQCHRARVFKKPPALGHEQACALPVAALTVLDAFNKAQPAAGESVLIQSAAGGVGLAAIQLAQHHGMEIYATAGSDAKLAYLRTLGVKHLINYRSSDFEPAIRRMTAGRGVDVVLNTLPGDALQKGLNVLSAGGRYVEIAMTALKSANRIDLSVLGDNQSFFSVNLRKLGLNQPERLRTYFERMLELQHQGILRPMIGKVFRFDQYREACSWLADRNNSGKVVISLPECAQPARAAHAGVPAKVAELACGTQDIAIIGMSGRFAESENVEELWQHLAQGRDLVKPVVRWDLAAHHAQRAGPYCDRGSFLNEIDRFDPLFFGIAGVEARYMDPQQRIFLEESWRALEDAGYAAQYLKGKACGVFVGCTQGDYHDLFGTADVPAQSFWGNALSVVPARIAYHLDLRGPAVAIDTACSSSLVAIHQACQSLWLGEVDMAIAGGVFIQSTAKLYLSAERADMVSHRGHCHAFGDQADGFVPGEGAGVIVLKRAAQAVADGDHIYGVIRGTGIGQDGATNGITAPSPASQYLLESSVYRRFKVDPAQIQMLEAHGTGTALGDPIEFQALTRSFGDFTDKKRFCALGSIKSNIGHLAPAAGVAAVIKVLLSMQHRQIPPTLHCLPPNPHLELEDSPFYLADSLQPWPAGEAGKRLAAVSSFGFSGTNAHLVIEGTDFEVEPSLPRPAYLITLSAQSWEQLVVMATNLVQRIRRERPDCGHLSHTLLTGRKHFSHRLACVVRDTAELAERLSSWTDKRQHPAVLAAQAVERSTRLLDTFESVGNRYIAGCAQGVAANQYVENLSSLAELFIQGYGCDYAKLFAGGSYRKLSLPTYPFARNRYWVQPAAAPSRELGKVLHPLLQQNVSTFEHQRYRSEFSGTEPFFSDHRVLQQRVLSGVSYLEMAGVAAAAALDVEPLRIQVSELSWRQPLIANGPVEMTLELTRQGAGVVKLEFHSKQQGRSVRVCDCVASVVGVAISTDAVDFAKALAVNGCQRFDAASVYDAYAHRGIEYGPSHRCLTEVWVDLSHDQVFASLELPSSELDGSRFGLHPGLLDAALQATIGFDLAAGMGPSLRTLCLPCALRRVVRQRPLPPQAWVRAKRRTDIDVVVYDIDIFDAQGLPCLSLEGLEARAISASQTLDAAPGERADTTSLARSLPQESASASALLRPQWVKVTAGGSANSTWGMPQNTLAIGLNDSLDSQLRQVCPSRLTLDIRFDDDVAAITAKLAQCSNLQHLVLAFTEALPEALLDEQLIARANRASLFFFNLVKALIGCGYDTRELNWSIITRHAQACSEVDAIDPASAPIHGLVGSLAKEFPNWRIQLLDVDDFDRWSLPSLQAVPFDPMGNALLYRSKQLYRQQLQPCHLRAGEHTAYRDGGVYVIVGGAGGIGRVLSEYLIRHYRAKVVWIGRRALNAEISGKLDRIAVLGSRPLYISADAGNRSEMAAALEQIKQAAGPVNGLIHSAIVLEDKSFMNMSQAALVRVLNAKVAASVCMAQVFGKEPLDFVLFCSSANSFLKSPGQSSYVAGSVFEDALALRMAQLLDCPIKVINWGYWGTVGVVANQAVAQRMAALGIGSIDPEEAMALLERLLTCPLDQLVYLRTLRPLTSLGLEVRSDEYAEVAPEISAGDVMLEIQRTVARELAERPGVQMDDSHEQIERLLLPLLWSQIKAAGLVITEPAAAMLDAYSKVASRYDRWLDESLHALVERGLLQWVGDHLVVPKDDAQRPDWQAWAALVDKLRQSDSQYWLRLVDRTVRALPDILRGRQLATEVLFPDASLRLVEGVYKSDRIARWFNQSLATIVATYVRQRSAAAASEPIRILELGAGTGATSEPVFARLKAGGLRLAEYRYTDVSKAFLTHARERYSSDVDYLTCDVLNIEQPGAAIKPHVGRYDLVIAGNVLHATRDIAATLSNAKSLLKRHGLLVVNEISKNTLLMHLSFGLLDGWWLYEDAALRMRGCPGLTPERWRHALTGLGFTRVEMPLVALHGLGYQIIVAQSDGVIVNRETPVPPQHLVGKAARAATARSVAASPALRTASESGAGIKQRMADCIWGDKAEALQLLTEHLRHVAAGVLGIDVAQLDSPHKPFAAVVLGNFGMDSLLSSTLRNHLLKQLEVDVAVQVLIGEPIAEILEQIYQQLLLRQVSGSQGSAAEAGLETHVF